MVELEKERLPGESDAELHARLYVQDINAWRHAGYVVGVNITKGSPTCIRCPSWLGCYHIDHAPASRPDWCLLDRGCTATYEPIFEGQTPPGSLRP